MTEIIITLIAAVLASNGLWTIVNTVVMRKQNKKDENRNKSEEEVKEIERILKELEKSNELQQNMLKGLAHDRILNLGNEYIERGFITSEEYDNLYNYIYIPAKALNIDGSSQRIMEKIHDLPIKA